MIARTNGALWPLADEPTRLWDGNWRHIQRFGLANRTWQVGHVDAAVRIRRSDTGEIAVLVFFGARRQGPAELASSVPDSANKRLSTFTRRPREIAGENGEEEAVARR